MPKFFYPVCFIFKHQLHPIESSFPFEASSYFLELRLQTGYHALFNDFAAKEVEMQAFNNNDFQA